MRKTITVVALSLLASAGAFMAQADNLVTNPGFETGDLTGWTLSGTDSSPSGNEVYYGVDAGDAHTGNYGAYFGPVGGVLNLSQILATTPGASYDVSFWLAEAPSEPSPYVNSFSASFGGSTLVSLAALPMTNYALYSYSGVATSSATTLLFSFRDDTGFLSLDDVSVGASSSGPGPVPEPASLWLTCPALAAFVFARRRISSR